MIAQNIKAMVEKSLSMHGIVVGFGDAMQKAGANFNEEATKLVVDGKIRNLEQRYDGLKEAGQALADVHLGKTLGKPVIIVAEN